MPQTANKMIQTIMLTKNLLLNLEPLIKKKNKHTTNPSNPMIEPSAIKYSMPSATPSK
jgi:hypothetical protein